MDRKDLVIPILFVLFFVVAILLMIESYKKDLQDKPFPNPDFMAQCIALDGSGEIVRCIGERVMYVNSEVVFYQCNDGYKKVTSPFTHICEDRRRFMIAEINGE